MDNEKIIANWETRNVFQSVCVAFKNNKNANMSVLTVKAENDDVTVWLSVILFYGGFVDSVDR